MASEDARPQGRTADGLTAGRPVPLSVTFRNADLAEMATWVTGMERTGTTEASTTDDDPIRLYRRFVTTVLLTRDIAE